MGLDSMGAISCSRLDLNCPLISDRPDLFSFKKKNFTSSLALPSMLLPPPPLYSPALILRHAHALNRAHTLMPPSALPRTSATPTLDVPLPFLLAAPIPTEEQGCGRGHGCGGEARAATPRAWARRRAVTRVWGRVWGG